jgi:thioredoxin reductase/SAM-dependent methyltransferase
MVEQNYDVVVVGGGAAGLGAALSLARARRSVLVVDAGQQRNAPAGHVHTYPGRESTPPAELVAIGRAEVTGYGAEVVSGRVESAARDGDGFLVTLADGRSGARSVRARRVLLATGTVDVLPDIPGLAGRWGRDVLHCPYCHGWEVRDRRIGVLATGPRAVEQALLWRQWSEHVTLLVHQEAAPEVEQAEQLAARGIFVVDDGPVAGLEIAGDALTGVRLTTGEVVPVDALVVAAYAEPRPDLLDGLGLKLEDVTVGGHVLGRQIPAGPNGATEVPGVWVAGNASDVAANVIGSAAAGVRTGAMINADLVVEDTRVAVDAYRDRVLQTFEPHAWEERYRARPAVWSGRPNAQLVAEAGDLAPGRALDAGCGEGADAIWLAERGWAVTAVDVSTVALERAAIRAGEAGVRVDWVHADLRREPPAEGRYDLVSAQFMHLPPDQWRDLFARLAAAVAPGGTLLVVGHHPSDLRTSAHRMHFPDMMFTADRLVAALDPDRWRIVAAQTRPRIVADPEGRDVTIRDAVLVARLTG